MQSKYVTCRAAESRTVNPQQDHPPKDPSAGDPVVKFLECFTVGRRAFLSA